MNSHIISTPEDFEQLKTYLESQAAEYVVIDTETDNVVEKKASLYGLGLCVNVDEAFYFPIRKNTGEYIWTEEQETVIANWLYEFCSTRKLIGHNVIYDILVLQKNWQLDFTPFVYSDTILQKHLLDEERPHGLKETAVKYLGAWADKAQKELYDNIKANGGRVTKANMDMYKANTEILATYCCWDTMLTLKLFQLFEPKLYEQELAQLFYVDEIMPLYKEVTIPMKMKGFPIDVAYFKELDRTISLEINKLEEIVQEAINPIVAAYKLNKLYTKYPMSTSGTFPKVMSAIVGLKLPITKTGKVTLAKAALKKMEAPTNARAANFYSYLTGEYVALDVKDIEAALQLWHCIKTKGAPVFNLNSNADLKYLFFRNLQCSPLNKTDKGDPQVDEDFLDSVKAKYPWAQTLIDYKKLMKLKSTYIEGILDVQIDGVVRSSYKQFGPPTGRYSSSEPNCQNLPRLKEDDSGLSELVLKYVNSIKRGFISGDGYKLVNADYSQLEPRAFAEACGDYLLQQVFINGEDLYGSIAKNIWSLDCKANEVKKLHPELRQKAKIVALAVVYGAESGRISKLMGVTYQEADKIISDYLDAYEGLKTYMEDCDREACLNGFVRTKFGRIRHLPAAKAIYKKHGLQVLNRHWAVKNGVGELRWVFKNLLNQAKNYKIQGVAAHVVNRAAIAVARKFQEENIEGYLVAQCHDELCFKVAEGQAERAKVIVKDCMENTTKLSVPLIAEPIIGENWAEVK